MFDDEYVDEKRREKLEEEKYQELYQKQMKVTKLILLFTFMPIGSIFFVIGLVTFLSYDSDLLVFMILGGFFIFLGILLYFCIPKKGNYERYKKNVYRFGGMNSYNMVIQIGLLEERVKNLEHENKELQIQIRELDRKINR